MININGIYLQYMGFCRFLNSRKLYATKAKSYKGNLVHLPDFHPFLNEIKQKKDSSGK